MLPHIRRERSTPVIERAARYYAFGPQPSHEFELLIILANTQCRSPKILAGSWDTCIQDHSRYSRCRGKLPTEITIAQTLIDSERVHQTTTSKSRIVPVRILEREVEIPHLVNDVRNVLELIKKVTGSFNVVQV